MGLQMNKKFFMLLVGLFLINFASGFSGDSKKDAKEPGVNSVHAFVVKNIDGNDVKLGDYAGKVLLIVNVASKCGFTSQYTGLEELYLKYQDQGLVILGFPANNFLGQEPGTNAEIKQFCSANYQVTFPMFSKISVKGDDQAPLYQYLTGKTTNPKFSGEISWNFNKFLIDRKGAIADRFGSRDKPESEKIVQAIEKALKPVAEK
jgi:glutathione peroxidase